MRVKDRVEQLLRQDPKNRDSDKRLLLNYWEAQGLFLQPHQREAFMQKCTTAESITRARRALRDRYPESNSIFEERHNKFNDYKYGKAINWMEEAD